MANYLYCDERGIFSDLIAEALATRRAGDQAARRRCPAGEPFVRKDREMALVDATFPEEVRRTRDQDVSAGEQRMAVQLHKFGAPWGQMARIAKRKPNTYSSRHYRQGSEEEA